MASTPAASARSARRRGGTRRFWAPRGEGRGFPGEGGAGGHLSLMAALGERKEFPCEAGLDGHRVPVRCAVAYYPSTSFVHPELHAGSNFENPRRLVPILGGPLEERRDVARKLSPVELL